MLLELDAINKVYRNAETFSSQWIICQCLQMQNFVKSIRNAERELVDESGSKFILARRSLLDLRIAAVCTLEPYATLQDQFMELAELKQSIGSQYFAQIDEAWKQLKSLETNTKWTAVLAQLEKSGKASEKLLLLAVESHGQPKLWIPQLRKKLSGKSGSIQYRIIRTKTQLLNSVGDTGICLAGDLYRRGNHDWLIQTAIRVNQLFIFAYEGLEIGFEPAVRVVGGLGSSISIASPKREPNMATGQDVPFTRDYLVEDVYPLPAWKEAASQKQVKCVRIFLGDDKSIYKPIDANIQQFRMKSNSVDSVDSEYLDQGELVKSVELEIGSWIIEIRGGADHETITGQLEDNFGAETIEEMYSVAGRYKQDLNELVESGRMEELISALASHGHSPSKQSLKNWCGPKTLAPKYRDEFKELLNEMSKMGYFAEQENDMHTFFVTSWHAIRTIRGQSISAGNALSKEAFIQAEKDFRSRPTQIDMNEESWTSEDGRTVWRFRIAAICSEQVGIPEKCVNKIFNNMDGKIWQE